MYVYVYMCVYVSMNMYIYTHTHRNKCVAYCQYLTEATVTAPFTTSIVICESKTVVKCWRKSEAQRQEKPEAKSGENACSFAFKWVGIMPFMSSRSQDAHGHMGTCTRSHMYFKLSKRKLTILKTKYLCPKARYSDVTHTDKWQAYSKTRIQMCHISESNTHPNSIWATGWRVAQRRQCLS
jgi:hypothetical protein